MQDSLTGGASAAAGASYEGQFHRPTVLTGLSEDSPAWTQEIFGPVAPVMSFETVDEAVELVNRSGYGLSLGILGEVGEAVGVADRVEVGKVHINEQTVSDEPQAPFGGFKDSGNGTRIGGHAANIESFTETQWLTVRPDIAECPF